jgi:hypothetical protein
MVKSLKAPRRSGGSLDDFSSRVAAGCGHGSLAFTLSLGGRTTAGLARRSGGAAPRGHSNGAPVNSPSCRGFQSVCGQTCVRRRRRRCRERAPERGQQCAPAPDSRHRARRRDHLVRCATRHRQAARETVVRGHRPQTRIHQVCSQADARIAGGAGEGQANQPRRALTRDGGWDSSVFLTTGARAFTD